MSDRAKSVLFVSAVVVGSCLAASIAQAAVGVRGQAVYGGVIGLLAAMYWQQRGFNRNLTRIVNETVAEIKDMLAKGRT